MKYLIILFIFSSFTASVLSQENADLKKLVETERAFARMAAEKSTKEAFLHFLADDGIVFEPTAVNAKEVWSKRPDSVGLLSWEPVWADISADGTIGYTTGPWEFRPKGKDGDPVAFGQYVTIWKKQKDGEFRAVLDIGISHGRHEGPAPKLSFPNDAATGNRGAVNNSGPRHPPLDLSYSDYVASDIRFYSEGALPILEKEVVVKSMVNSANETGGYVSDGSTGGVDELRFEYGVEEITRRNEEILRVNFLRIWKFRGKNWQLVLNLTAPIPAVNKNE